MLSKCRNGCVMHVSCNSTYVILVNSGWCCTECAIPQVCCLSLSKNRTVLNVEYDFRSFLVCKDDKEKGKWLRSSTDPLNKGLNVSWFDHRSTPPPSASASAAKPRTGRVPPTAGRISPGSGLFDDRIYWCFMIFEEPDTGKTCFPILKWVFNVV